MKAFPIANMEGSEEFLGMDLRDDSLRGTPLRVAKMYVKELFQGLNPANMTNMTLFENKFPHLCEFDHSSPFLLHNSASFFIVHCIFASF